LFVKATRACRGFVSPTVRVRVRVCVCVCVCVFVCVTNTNTHTHTLSLTHSCKTGFESPAVRLEGLFGACIAIDKGEKKKKHLERHTRLGECIAYQTSLTTH